MIRSLCHDHDAAKAAVAQSGLLQQLHAAWRAIVVFPPLLVEALTLLGCVLADSFEARHIVASEGRPPLLIRMTRILFRCAVCFVSRALYEELGCDDCGM
jgi:hypothetical protein